MSSSGTIRRPVNTGIHLDEWMDLDNQVHKFYEPVYPGPLVNETFTDTSRDDSAPGEAEKSEFPNELLPF